MKSLILSIFLISAISQAYDCIDNICPGKIGYVEGHKNSSHVVQVFPYYGRFEVANSVTSNIFSVTPMNFALAEGCTLNENYCVGDRVHYRGHKYASTVIGIFGNGDIYVENSNSKNKYRGNESNIASAEYCEATCPGDSVYLRNHNYYSTVEAVFPNSNEIIARNSNSKAIYTSDEHGYAITYGCIRDGSVCVGDSVRKYGHSYFSKVIGLFFNDTIKIKNNSSGNVYDVLKSDLIEYPIRTGPVVVTAPTRPPRRIRSPRPRKPGPIGPTGPRAPRIRVPRTR